MSTFRKLGCLLGLVIGMSAGNAFAQSIPYTHDSRDDQRADDYDRSQDDTGYGGDRYDDNGHGDNGYGYGDNGYGDNGYDERDSRYDDRYDGRYRRIIVCESLDRRTTYCNADVSGGIRLTRQLSDRRCIRGSNWGTNNRGVWVTGGCRAEFEISGSQRYGQTVRCESNDNHTHYCNADTRYGVRMWRQLSRTSCREGYNWGVTRDSIWVSRGCRADFRVGDRGGRSYRE